VFNWFMHPGQAQLIRESFAKIEPRAAIAALMFYQRLFALDPSLRALFQHDIEHQAVKLMQALRFAVTTLDNPRELQPVLESLGRRHVHYGVEERHYETVGIALLDAIECLLGPDFTPEVREAWLAIYKQIADTMKRAASQAIQTSGNTQFVGKVEPA
jgi:hemoglobin-like flavoprotein